MNGNDLLRECGWYTPHNMNIEVLEQGLRRIQSTDGIMIAPNNNNFPAASIFHHAQEAVVLLKRRIGG